MFVTDAVDKFAEVWLDVVMSSSKDGNEDDAFMSLLTDVRITSRSSSSGVLSSNATVFLKSDKRADAQPEFRLSEFRSSRKLLRLISTALIFRVFSSTRDSFSTNIASSSERMGEDRGLIILIRFVWFNSWTRSFNPDKLSEDSMLLTLK
ncbi:hypothetical protein OGAPHI_005757 [Ogataea philodendri]|uniref:Uncharacterized protein n=1 Tax=Ogataea philodendri TaxID=1378263 RepID=A0A9P8NZD9_9ASCO|nr:uncharacterized protein OGAPHI_005757 [Ogataea philodendri]KAH3662505.1 hypothetical protein OGAPHI_005757 [Ogataea philodendri]